MLKLGATYQDQLKDVYTWEVFIIQQFLHNSMFCLIVVNGQTTDTGAKPAWVYTANRSQSSAGVVIPATDIISPGIIQLYMYVASI